MTRGAAIVALGENILRTRAILNSAVLNDNHDAEQQARESLAYLQRQADNHFIDGYT